MLEQRLHIYKKEKAFLNATLLRIKRFQEILDTTDDETLVLIFGTNNSIEVGMPKAQTISKPEEVALIKKEVARETLEKWIRDDKSRIALLHLELEQIATALESLTCEEHFVIEKKYFEKWSWKKIELSMNNEMRKEYNDNYIGESGLKKINARAIGKIEFVLGGFYKKIGKSI